MKSVITMHVKTRIKDLNKFKIFCKVNETMPYIFKKKVLEAVIMCSLLYGCETWLANSFKEVEKLYVGAVKAILGVRETTRSDTVLIEAGMPTLQNLIRKRTAAFAKKEFLNDFHADTPLIKIYKICERKRTNGFRYLSNILNPISQRDPTVAEKFVNENGSKASTYRTLNSNLSVHLAYTCTEYINERERLAFTKFRLSSHRLKIETGRWSRINVENRLCDCGGGIEDETHVLFDCTKTEGVRRMFDVNRTKYINIGVLMDKMNVHDLVSFVYNCMKFFT